MHKWKIGTIIGIFILSAFLLSSPSAYSQRKSTAKPIELAYSIFFPTNHTLSLSAAAWAKEIEKRSNGRVKINLFYGGTLTPADKCYDGVEKGISDLGQSCMAYSRGRFPLSEVIDLPLGYQNGLQATRVINAFYRKFKPAEYAGVQVMYFHAHGPGLLHTKSPVRSLEQVKGKKIRCTGLAAKVVTSLGGVPVAMPMGETYDALSRGIVNGSMAPVESLENWKWGEVVGCTTENYGSSYTTGMFVVMNKNKWNSLPADIKQIFLRVNNEWIDKSGRAWDEADAKGRIFIKKLGNTVVPISKKENARWAKAVKPIMDEYVTAMQAKRLPGKEALDFCLSQVRRFAPK
ncbi:MAG: TRAP transporter substrate-binding protein [Candidatus Ratteibacteria bacterium]